MNSTTNSYIKNLHAAYEFTKKMGASFSRLPEIEGELFTDTMGNKLHNAIKGRGISAFDGAVGQCVKWSHSLRPHVEKALGIPILLTLGQVSNKSTPYFNPTHDDLENWYRRGFTPTDFEGRSGMNLHAWWTLPSGEIIDVTLWSTLSVVWNKPEFLGGITGGWPDKIAPSPIYVPMVVGDDYIETVERHMEYGRFLAAECTPAELNAYPMIGFKT